MEWGELELKLRMREAKWRGCGGQSWRGGAWRQRESGRHGCGCGWPGQRRPVVCDGELRGEKSVHGSAG